MLSDRYVKSFAKKLKQVRYKDLNGGKLLVLSLDRNYKDVLDSISSVKKLYKTISYNPETKLLTFKSHYDNKTYRGHSLYAYSKGNWVPRKNFKPNNVVGWRGPLYIVRKL